jgi:hypothetical protein
MLEGLQAGMALTVCSPARRPDAEIHGTGMINKAVGVIVAGGFAINGRVIFVSVSK